MFIKSRSTRYISPLSALVILSVITLLITQFVFLGKINSLSGSQFNASNIIDDAIFFNSTSMSPQQIQDFLNSKVPTCDTNGSQIYSGSTTRAQYGASRGYPAPYICLKDYSQTIPSVTNSGSDLCKNSISGGLKSAALILYDVAQACDINPQVLIVMLQKEMSLVTDDWPWPSQYDKAMGYACPDSGPNNSANCDSAYFGFFNQVYNAAQAYRRYEANPDSYNYKANRNNYILYNPNTACGGTNVFIENQATANLYIYTPYQPNTAALNNLYGTGDSCSAYGNRNFWRLFNDWFGSTIADSFSSTPVSSWSSIPTGTMVSGDRAKVIFKVRNTGNTTWNKTNTKLGTAEPYDRTSVFRDSTWPSKNRAGSLKEDSVAPGDVGTFEFWYQAPNTIGNFTEKFSVVVEGAGWTPYNGLFLSTNVVSPNYSAQVLGVGSFKDSLTGIGRDTSKMAPGEKAYVFVKVKNSGNRTWVNSGNNPTRLATAGPLGRGSGFQYGWQSSSRVTNMVESSVAPGKTATFKFWYHAPNIPGTHKEEFTLVHEGLSWTEYFGFHINTVVSGPETDFEPVSAASNIVTGTMKKGTKALVTFKVKNTGNYTWKKSSTRLGTAEPYGRISTFRYDSWPTANRTTSMVEESVAPGEIGTFTFWYQAPNNIGIYEEKFTPVVEGISWTAYKGLYLKTEVTN